jgi:FkbM family methyltransferase
MSINLHKDRLLQLQQKGFFPNIIYDIGAFHGLWSREIQTIFPLADFYLFEANEDNRNALSHQPFPFFIELLGDEEREAVFYFTETPSSGESLFLEQTSYFDESKVQRRMLKMRTLSSVVQKHLIPYPDMIKIDVQGAEKLIIEGSLSLICLAEVVILETKILEYNQGAPLIHEMIKLMTSLGYRILDVLEWHYLPTGELNEMDLLFIKNTSKFIKSGLMI